VWLSVVVHGAIVFLFWKLLLKRSWMAFAIGFYLFHLFLVSNLAMPIGATMGERLIYHSSLGFIMIAVSGLLALIKKTPLFSTGKMQPVLYIVLLVALIAPMSYAVVQRNPDWETDNILFMHDAWVVPNSVLANGNSGKAYIELAQKDTVNRQAYLDSAIYHLERALSFHPKYVNGYLNIGLAWFQKGNLEQTEYYWNMARKYFPNHPFFRNSYDPALANALVDRARQEGQKGNVKGAIDLLARALKYDSSNPNTWYHYGGANFSVGNVSEAQKAWNKCLEIAPNHHEAQVGLQALMNQTNHPPKK
jgi:tetratricopeptide (TPR) repeat protein